MCIRDSFEPGCRNNWHIHHADKGGGQLLLCTAGEGWYQEEGQAAVSLHEGSVVMIPANVKHWHGAKTDSWFSHIAVEAVSYTHLSYLPPQRRSRSAVLWHRASNVQTYYIICNVW